MHLVVGNISIERLIEVEEFPKNNDDLFVKNYYELCGGAAANVAVMLSNLGLNVSLLSKVGDDCFGDKLIEDLEKHGVDTSNIYKTKEHQTSIFSCIMDRIGNRNFYLSRGASFYLNNKEIEETLKLEQESVSIIGIGKEHYKSILNKSNGVRNYINMGTLVSSGDIKKEDIYFFSSIDNVFMNEEEAKKLLKSTYIDFSSYFNSSRGLDNIIVTRGEKGSSLYRKDYNLDIHNIPKVTVINTLGCGDAFMAGWIYADQNELDFKRKLNMGHYCAKLIAETHEERINKDIHLDDTISIIDGYK